MLDQFPLVTIAVVVGTDDADAVGADLFGVVAEFNAGVGFDGADLHDARHALVNALHHGLGNHLALFDRGRRALALRSEDEKSMGFAYNKDRLPPSAVPKNYDGLLNPALKGRMAFVTTDTGSRTVGAMLRIKGDEYLKRLRVQDLTMHSVSAQALNDMIISGEVEASPTIFRNHALVAAAKGAPVAWLPMEIVPASAGSAGLSSQAPHPHAAVLFIDFLFSPDGQKILESYDYGSAVKEYGFKRWYIEKGMKIAFLQSFFGEKTII